MAQGQGTLAVYLGGLACGQLIYGPWSDRIGRRPTLLIGISIYLLACVGCANITTMNELIALRFLQALGACSGLLISIAVVRDRFDRQGSARILSILLSLRSVGPLVAPLAGGVIVTWLGWRAIFWTLVVFGAVLGSAAFLGLEESRTEAVAACSRSESPIGAYAAILRNTRVLGYMLTGGLNFCCMFAWIVAAPYLIIGVYKVPVRYFGWIFACIASGVVIGSQFNQRLLNSYHSDCILAYAAPCAAVMAAILLVDALTNFGGVFGILLPLFAVNASLGFVSTNAAAGGLAVDPSRAGAVSALFGASQFAAGGLTAVAAAHLSPQPAVAMATVIMICSAGALVFPLRLLARRRAAALNWG
jgi:DHA1 family bicyclomycin/chloramphenicol resistance-like MFS transporter